MNFQFLFIIFILSSCVNKQIDHSFITPNPNLIASTNYVHYNSPSPKLYIEFGIKQEVLQSDLSQLQQVQDLIPGFPINWLHQVQQLIIIPINSSDSIRSNSIEFTENQHAFFKTLGLNEQFRCIVDFTTINRTDSSISEHHFDSQFLVIPFQHAQPSVGREQFLKEFNDYLSAYSLIGKQEEMAFSVVIDKTGKLNNLEFHSGENGLTQATTQFLNQNQYKWLPARSKSGEPVEELIQFKFGVQGC